MMLEHPMSAIDPQMSPIGEMNMRLSDIKLGIMLSHLKWILFPIAIPLFLLYLLSTCKACKASKASNVMVKRHDGAAALHWGGPPPPQTPSIPPCMQKREERSR